MGDQSQMDDNIHRLHPDADAGLSQILMIPAAVFTVKVGTPANITFNAKTGSLQIDGPKLIKQLQAASQVEIEKALRPIFNEALISSYAALQAKHGIGPGDDRPEVQFLRHARNASGHGNVFNLLAGEPRKPAVWRGIEITSELNGAPFLYQFLKAGDVLRLIDDVFQLVDPQ